MIKTIPQYVFWLAAIIAICAILSFVFRQSINKLWNKVKNMNSEEFKNVTESSRNIILALAIIVGGGWSLYVFNSKLEVRNARALLQKLERDIMERPILMGSINIGSKHYVAEGYWVIISEVVIENKGNTDTYLKIIENSLGIAKIKFEDGMAKSYEKPMYTWARFFPFEGGEQKPFTESLTILAGQSKILKFICKVRSPGIYQVQFCAKPDKNVTEARNVAREHKKSFDDVYSISEYVFIDREEQKEVEQKKGRPSLYN